MNAFHPLAALLAALLAHGAAAAGYSALDVTPAGTSDCQPIGLNSLGQVVGSTVASSSGQRRGFVTGPSGVGARLIDTLGGNMSGLGKINDRGQAVGQAALPGDVVRQAILVEAGATVPTPIGPLGQPGSASALNNKGRVVGTARDPADRLYHAFITSGHRLLPRQLDVGLMPVAVLADGTVAGTVDLGTSTQAYLTGPDAQGLTVLGSLGGAYTVALDMNQDRVLVGFASNADDSWRHAFVTDSGGSGLRDLGVPGVFSLAQAINNKGKVVGFYTLDWSRMFAFVAKVGGSWKALDSLVTLPGGATLTQAWDINDAGQIAAQSSDQRCYLLTPTP